MFLNPFVRFNNPDLIISLQTIYAPACSGGQLRSNVLEGVSMAGLHSHSSKHLFVDASLEDLLTIQALLVAALMSLSDSGLHTEMSTESTDPELWYVAYVVVGIVIFFCADSWSRNTALHYTTGVSVGILASVLIALFVISRFLPQTVRRLTYLIGMIGGSVFLYCIKFIQTELQVILKDYWQYVVGYIVVFGFISFAVVYKFGPVTNPRTLDLVRWILQGTALCLVYSGTQLPEASVAIIIVMLSVHNFPKKVTLLFKRLR
ncbi:nuclear envelope integral membrane protein 1-like [Gigantopelta aegis]|uniref:nuclear envelope integral membrane protein 1-like n=1 Tax=Gigantopelta aegis TaxID=1735272 RepID=UPI001B88D9B8|nr:nuclear envelope integral membrane protein 1-like [Gigantopelta aegis]